jgi:hypothetical protein
MAITRRLQAQTIVTTEQHSKLATMRDALLKQHIEILSATPTADGKVNVVFCGRGLGSWAIPVPPPCDVEIAEKEIKVNRR